MNMHAGMETRDRPPLRQAVVVVRGVPGGGSVDDPLALLDGRRRIDWLLWDARRFGVERLALVAPAAGDASVAWPEGVALHIVPAAASRPKAALREVAAELDTEVLLLDPTRLPGGSLQALARIDAADLALLAAEGFDGPHPQGAAWMLRDALVRLCDGPAALLGEAVATELATGRAISVAGTYAPTLLKDLRARLQRPAAFLDRDGVLIVDDGYPHDPAKVTWISGAAVAVRRLNQAGYFVFVVTNQAGVARGLYTEETVQALHRWMARQLADHGAHIDAFEYCPYHPEALVPEYRRLSERRKPSPGMLLHLMKHWPVRREGSFMIGDRDSDVAAGSAAGVPGYLFDSSDLDRAISAILAKSAAA